MTTMTAAEADQFARAGQRGLPAHGATPLRHHCSRQRICPGRRP
jgi:hypothetical protein